MPTGTVDPLHKVAHFFQIRRPHRLRVDPQHFLNAFEVAEALETLEGKGQFLFRKQMKNHQLVLAIVEVMQRLDDFIRFVEKVADQHHQSAFGNALGHAVQNRPDIGVLAGFGRMQFLENPPHLARPTAGPHVTAQFLVEGRQSDRIALFDIQIRKRRGQMFGVAEFRQRHAIDLRRRCSGVFHRTGHIHDHHRALVGFLDVLLDDVAIALRHHPPVEIFRVVAGRILAVLGKFDGKSLVRRGVPTAQRTEHALAGIPFETTHHAHRFVGQQLHAVGKCQRGRHDRT